MDSTVYGYSRVTPSLSPYVVRSRLYTSHWSQNTKVNGLLVAQQSANDFPSHVEKHDVKVHDVVEVDPLAAMPKEMYIYLSSRTRITRSSI